MAWGSGGGGSGAFFRMDLVGDSCRDESTVTGISRISRMVRRVFAPSSTRTRFTDSTMEKAGCSDAEKGAI